MRVIFPVSVDEAVLVSSSVPEDDAPEWSDEATYARGDVVMKVATHTRWESLIDDNSTDPDADDHDPPHWLELGATNRWAMLREPIQAVTEAEEEIVVRLRPGLVRGIALFNLDAALLELSLVSEVEGVVWSRTHDLVFDGGVNDYYEYFFEPPVRQLDYVALDIPPYGDDGELEVRISAPAGTVSCGWLAVGPAKYIGDTRYGAQFSITDFSRKEYDTFGQQTRRRGNYAKRAAIELWVENAFIEGVFQELARRRSDLLVWAVVEEWKPGLTLQAGTYKDFSVMVPYPTESHLLLEIEGMT